MQNRTLLTLVLAVGVGLLAALVIPSVAVSSVTLSPDDGTIVFSDNFSTDPNTSGRWTIHRYADDSSNETSWDSENKVLYLTRAVGPRATAMFADYQLESTQWQASFRYKAGGGSGADGFVFMFYKDAQAYGRPNAGGTLGFLVAETSWDPVPGYGIEFDSYYNTSDPSSNHIAIIEDTPQNHLISTNDGRTEDNIWHDVVVEFDNGHIEVFVDGDGVISYTLAAPDYTYTGVGFAAATWSYHNNHIIDDFVLTTMSGPTFSISGRVLDNNAVPIPDAVISAGAGVSVSTDASGYYTVTGLITGTYTITPNDDCYTFSPVSRTVNVPPSSTGQVFTGISKYDLSKQPIVFVHGWHGGANSLQEDEQLSFFIDYLGAGYAENCNLWYAQGVSEDNRLHQNAERIQATLRQAYDHISAYDPSFDGHFDIIAHSMGGINSRAYLESDRYEHDQTYRGGIRIDNLFTLGTPHGGAGDVPTALLFAALALREDFWGDLPSVCELTPLYMSWFNLRHRQPDGVCYRLLGGNINEQIPFLEMLYAWPNDLLVSQASAHFLGYFPLSLKWRRTVKEYLPDMHGYKWQLSFLRSYVQPRTTFDECIKDYVGVSSYSCSSSSPTALETTAPAESTPTSYRVTPFVTGIITTGQSLTGTLAIDSSGHTGFYLAWYEGDLDFTLVAPDSTVVNTTTAEADPNVSFLALDALLSTEIYVITNTLTGTWAFTVTAVTLPYTMPYAVYAVLDTPINLALSTDAEWYTGGSPMAITATLMYSATALTGASVQAEASRPDGATEIIVLLDDGAHNDGAADDGVYGGQYSGTTVGGYYGVIATASGSYASQDYQRSAQAIFAVSPGTASLSGTYSDQAEDADSNGLYEYLVVQMGLDVTQAGDYSLAAVLEGTGDQYIDHAITDVTLGAGSQVVTLRFDGDAIRGSGLDGPYTVTQVLLMDNSEIAVKLDEAHDAWTTAAYNHRQFGSSWRIYLPIVLKNY